MNKLILVTGGARSGKSTFAENYVKENCKDVLYIATAIPFDDEMKDRIKKHREQRPKSFTTYEGYKDLGSIIKEAKNKGILLDCLTIMVTNLMFDYMGDEPVEQMDFNGLEKKIMLDLENMLQGVKEYDGTIVMVTNELGCGVVPESKLGRIFRDIAGRVNQMVASQADEVYLCVCGIPTKIKGGH